MFIFDSKLVNGNYIDLSINSESLNYGFSIFETLKLYDGKAQLLKEHINRLNNSLSSLNINYKLDIEITANDIEELICTLDVTKGAIKIFVLENDGSYHTLISYSSRVYQAKLYKRGYKVILSQYRTNELSAFTYHKTANYGDNILALRDAKSKGYDEVIFRNSKDFISEGSLSNIFIVKDDTVYTPCIESGILDGIMRKFVIKILEDLDIEIIEKQISLEELENADEIFLSNSLMNIMPVSTLDAKTYSLDKFKIYKKIKKQLHLLLKEDYFE